MSDYETRFAGLRRLYGDTAFGLLRELHICVVGLGGVGSWSVEALARSGVGRLTLIDYDTVCASNVNRQSHALTRHFGRKKIEVLAERVHEINPGIECHVIDDFLTDRNNRDYLERGYDYVIDAIDSIRYKAVMIYTCKRNKIPVITTGGAGGRRDPTRIRIVDLSRTCNDALAAKVRKHLRDHFGFTRNPRRYFGVECVFSDEQPVYPKADGTVCPEKPGIHGVHLDCSMGYGAATAVTATFGMVAASRALDKALARRLRQRQEGG
ncbi:MAG: tRNA cyclic N6-threonylcarbamoyladenosine(37) synthase TcdA [Gammaproteobacteria bacterium]